MAVNAYQKLQSARLDLQECPIKASGNNKFAGYTYMELGDFIPHVNRIFAERGLCGVVSFGETATLTVVNCENPDDRIVFSSPMSTANLKGCHDIQNLGAVQTYLRRYLYVAALEIVEHDALDSTHGKEERRDSGSRPPLASVKKDQPAAGKAEPPAPDPGIAKLLELVKPHGLKLADIENHCVAKNKGLALKDVGIDGLRNLYRDISHSLKDNASGFVADVSALRPAA